MLAGPIALELLHAVAGRDAEILEPFGGVHHAKLPEHEPVELGWEAPDTFATEQPFRITIGEGRDHCG